MRKWIIILMLFALAIIAYKYIYKDHRDINNEDPEFVISSLDLINEFNSNPSVSEKKFLNKTIEVKGNITESSDFDLTLDATIFCQFNYKIEAPSKSVNIKGRFIGYDNLLEQIKLDQCNILTKH